MKKEVQIQLRQKISLQKRVRREKISERKSNRMKVRK